MELEVCPPDTFMIFCTLKKLEATMPQTYLFLERDFKAGKLDCDGLMRAISREISREKAASLDAMAYGRQRGCPRAESNDTTDNLTSKTSDWGRDL